MARSEKNTIDYFPHMVNHGKTMYIIESKYGNDGYSAIFKLFELLGVSENHYFDCRNAEEMEFLLAKMKLNQSLLDEIFNTLANCGTIHKELWDKKIIWSGNFLKNIEDVYRRRNTNCMYFDDLCKHIGIKCKHKYTDYGIIVNTNPQSRVEESRVEESKPFYADFEKCVLTESQLGNFKTICEEVEKLHNVQSLKTPLTSFQVFNLIKEHGKEPVMSVLNAMENFNGLKKKYVSAYLTANNWIKQRAKKCT